MNLKSEVYKLQILGLNQTARGSS